MWILHRLKIASHKIGAGEKPPSNDGEDFDWEIVKFSMSFRV